MTDQPTQTRVISSLASESDMAELIDMFVDELPSRLHAFEQAIESQNWESIRTISHQLKGAAPGYGFESVGKAAGAVEHLILHSGEVAEIEAAIGVLLEICSRVAKA